MKSKCRLWILQPNQHALLKAIKWRGITIRCSAILLCMLLAACSEPPSPNASVQFTLRGAQHTYTFTIPAAYADKNPLDNLITLDLIYPSMEVDQRRSIAEDTVNVWLGAGKRYENMPQFFLKRASEKDSPYTYMGKEGKYDIYHSKDIITHEIEVTKLFTAKDGQLVLVDPRTSTYLIWRNISPEIGVNYLVRFGIGNDFIKIDEVISNFIKAHIKLETTQSKEKRS